MLQDTKYIMKLSRITQNYRDYVKFRQKMKSITLSGLTFELENRFSYHLLIIPVLMHSQCPGNIRVSRMLHRYQNLVSK